MFDIAALDVLTASDAGVPMNLIDLRTNEPMVDDQKNPVTITMRGRNSAAANAVIRAQIDRDTTLASQGNNKPKSLAELETDMIAVLVSCTVGWSFDTLAGAPFPFTPDNAKLFWADRRFMSIRRQANEFTDNLANFMQG